VKDYTTISLYNLRLFCFFPGNEESVQSRHKYACVSAPYCHSNRYSMECAVKEQIAMVGVHYGAKPYTLSCPKSHETCVHSRLCCHYESGDCIVPYFDEDLAQVYSQCSNHAQCGWFFAKSVELPKECRIRDKTNYVWAEYKCLHGKFINYMVRVNILIFTKRALKLILGA